MQDITASGAIVALVTAPHGGGSKNPEVIRDGVMPAAGSTSSLDQYDTYTGQTRSEDWIGYSFTTPRKFAKVVFQEGKHFPDGGWFTSLGVQVRQSGAWVNVASLNISPTYPGNNGVNFETFTLTFPATVGDGIRIYGGAGGTATFISVAELRVFEEGGSGNRPPVAATTPNQNVNAGATVTLDGSPSSDPDGDAISYAWTQTAGPAVTLSSASAQKATFIAPSLSTASTLQFSLVVKDATTTSSAATTSVTVAAASNPPSLADITASGAIVALITQPFGGGSKNPEVIRDGVMPAAGSTSSLDQYDTYTGQKRSEDWIGYTFSTPRKFAKVVFQEGKHFPDGGWLTNLNVQVRQSGAWVTVPSLVVSPAYPGNNGINFETFTLTFPTTVGDGVRIDGAPGGSATFISVGELRVFEDVSGSSSPPPSNSAPTANGGPAQSVASGANVTLDGSASSDPEGSKLSYAWTQTTGPAVTLSSSTAQKPTFVAPTVASSTVLGFSLVVNDGAASSAASTTSVTVAPTVPPPGGGAPTLRISANRRYLEDSQGTPFLLIHDAAWSIVNRVSDADVGLYFSDRAARGFNGSIIALIDRHDVFNPTGANQKGDTPFTGTVNGQPDFTTPRESFWQRVDYIIDTANAHGIVPLAFPIYVGAVNGRDGWYQAMLANGPARMQTYAQFVADRYRTKSLIWIVGGDLSPASTPWPMSAAGIDDLNAFATALRIALPSALISAHWAGEDQGSSTKYGNADMHVINGIYKNGISHDEALADYALPGPIPLFGLEAQYANASYSDGYVRAQSYELMCSGATGVSYGNGHIWDFDGQRGTAAPWQSFLGDPSTGDVQRLYQVFSVRPWHRLVPGGVVTAGGGTFRTNTYVPAAVTPEGDFMVAYVPEAHTGSTTIDMTKMVGTTRARWYDPRAGTWTDVAGSPFANYGTQAFTTPGANAGGDHDWLLVLESP